MENVIRDESGQLLDEPALERQSVPLSPEESACFEQQKQAIRDGASPQPMDVMAEYEHGQICGAAKPTGYWQRAEAYRDLSFSEFAAQISGKCSRQTIDRRILVARVFRRETVQRCQQGKVGMSVLIGLCGFHWRLRTPLLDLALQGVPTRALWTIKQAGEKALAAPGEEAERLQAAEAAMKEAHAHWQSGEARPVEKKKKKKPSLLPADLDEAGLLAAHAEIVQDLAYRKMGMDGIQRSRDSARQRYHEWAQRLREWEDDLASGTEEAVVRGMKRAGAASPYTRGLLVKVFRNLSAAHAPKEEGEVNVVQ